MTNKALRFGGPTGGVILAISPPPAGRWPLPLKGLGGRGKERSTDTPPARPFAPGRGGGFLHRLRSAESLGLCFSGAAAEFAEFVLPFSLFCFVVGLQPFPECALAFFAIAGVVGYSVANAIVSVDVHRILLVVVVHPPCRGRQSGHPLAAFHSAVAASNLFHAVRYGAGS